MYYLLSKLIENKFKFLYLAFGIIRIFFHLRSKLFYLSPDNDKKLAVHPAA